MAFLFFSLVLAVVAGHPHIWDVQQVLNVQTDKIVSYYGPYANYDKCQFYIDGLYYSLKPQRNEEANYEIKQVLLEDFSKVALLQNNRREQANELGKRMNEFYKLTEKEQKEFLSDIEIISRLKYQKEDPDKTELSVYHLHFNFCKNVKDSLAEELLEDESCKSIGDSMAVLINPDTTGFLDPQEYPKCISLSNDTMASKLS